MAALSDAVAAVAGFFLLLLGAHLGFYRERWSALIPGHPTRVVLVLASVAAVAGLILLVVS